MAAVKAAVAGRKKKSIKITNVPDESVIQHILPLDEINGRKKKKKHDLEIVYSPSCKNIKGYVERQDTDSDDENAMCIPGVPSIDTEINEDAMHGSDVFKFRTHKKTGQMAVRAEDCVSPSPSCRTPSKNTPTKSTPSKGRQSKGTPSRGTTTPSKGSPKVEITPKKSLRPAQIAESTPVKIVGEAATREHTRVEAGTPYRLRKRHQEDEQDSSSDDSVDESSDDDDNDDDDDDTSTRNQSGRDTTNNMTSSAEAYFDLHSMASVTSDRTMANLDGPRMDVSAVRDALKGMKMGHQQEIKILRQKHESLFCKWMLHMCHGYNILLYGLGSKRTLLDDFRTKHIIKYSHVVINGYFPSLTIKHILKAITEEIMQETQSFSNPQAQVKFIKDAYRNKDEDFFLVIHNIDGILLRTEKAQNVLSQLAEVEGFHIVASIDHINAPFLWDQNKCFRFRWLWFETPTYLPYESENAYENSLLVQQSGALALSSILHVMHSLTPNGRRVFLLLANHQLDQGDNSSYIGMSFQLLYQLCREDFLVNSDLTLQAQLVEFRDHRLIRSKKNYEGIEHLLIPVDKATLTEFLTEYKDGSG